MYDGVAILSYRDMGESYFANAINERKHLELGTLTSDARGLLVAMICCRKIDIFSSSTESDLISLHDIKSCLRTMTGVMEQSNGIRSSLRLGRGSTEINIHKWLSELHNCGLIKGDGGLRFTSDLKIRPSYYQAEKVKYIHQFFGQKVFYSTPKTTTNFFSRISHISNLIHLM